MGGTVPWFGADVDAKSDQSCRHVSRRRLVWPGPLKTRCLPPHTHASRWCELCVALAVDVGRARRFRVNPYELRAVACCFNPTEFGGDLPEIGDRRSEIGERSWRIDVVVEPLGFLGTYCRRARPGCGSRDSTAFPRQGTDDIRICGRVRAEFGAGGVHLSPNAVPLLQGSQRCCSGPTGPPLLEARLRRMLHRGSLPHQL